MTRKGNDRITAVPLLRGHRPAVARHPARPRQIEVAAAFTEKLPETAAELYVNDASYEGLATAGRLPKSSINAEFYELETNRHVPPDRVWSAWLCGDRLMSERREVLRQFANGIDAAGRRVHRAFLAYSHKHRRHDVNVQIVTDPGDRLLWLLPALLGHTHRIIRTCERQGVPIVADLAYQDAGPWLTTGIKRRPLQELTSTEKTRNHAPAATRAPVERGVAHLKTCRIFRRPRISPNRMTSITKTLLTLELQR